MRIPEQQRQQTSEYYTTNQAELPTAALDDRLAELMDLALIPHNPERTADIEKEIHLIVFELQWRDSHNALTTGQEVAA